MKKIYSILLFVLCCFLVVVFTSTNYSDKKFYYAFDEKIYLIPKENEMLVKFTDGFDKKSEELFLTNLLPDIEIKWRNNSMAEITTLSNKKRDELKTFLDSNDKVASCQPIYTLENGVDIGIFDEILVQFLPSVTEEQKAELNKRFRTKVIETYEIFQILKVSKGDDALEIANQYFESGLVKF